MAEEAADLAAGQHTAGVGVFVPGHHLDAQSLQLRRVQSPEDTEPQGLPVGLKRSKPFEKVTEK